MKKFTFLFTMLLLALVGSAATVTDVLTYEVMGLTTSYIDRTHDFGDRKYISNAYKVNDNIGGIQMRSNSNSGLVTTQSNGYIRSVKIEVKSGTKQIDVYGSNTAYTAVSDLYAAATKGTKLGSLKASGTVTVEGDYKYVAIRANNGAIYMTSIDLVWETSEGPVTPTCSAPQFSLAAGTYYGLEGYTKKIELTCGTEGAKIFYAQYDATTDPSTIPAGSFKEYTAPIEITCAGEYSVAAYAKCDGYNDSGLAKGTWKYEILEAEVVNSIAEFIAVDPETATTTVLNCPLYVTACSGKYLYVRDDAGDAILVYGPTEYECVNGTQFEAGSIAGTYALFKGLNEVTNPKFLKEPLSELATDKTQPLEVALEDVTADIQNQYVTIKCAKFNKTAKKLELGSASVAYYAGRFSFTVPENVDAYYSVTGVVEMYNNNVQVCPISYTEYVDESPEQVYIVGDVSDVAGNNYSWAPNKGIALTKVYPGVYNGKVVIEHGKYYAVFTALGANENDWDGLNANKYGLSNQNNVVMNKELPLLKGNQMHQFYSGTFDVTVDLNKMTIKYSTVNGYPEQLRIIGDLRMPGTYEEISWNTAVGKAVVADGAAGVYRFNGVLINKGGGFTFTAAVESTDWNDDESKNITNSINSWRIGPASAENGANILNQDGTVELLQWQSSNNIVVNTEDFKSTDPAYEDYAFAAYNLIVDLGAGTVTSDPAGFTGTEKIEIKGANVEVSGGTIIVSGAASIYNAAGQAIAINSKAGKFNVPAGLYFVRVDGKVTKVLVR